MDARWIVLALGLGIVAFAVAQKPASEKRTELKDGYVKVETQSYSLEVPKEWTVGKETPFGQRTIEPKSKNEGTMTAMTAGPPTRATWDELYRTSLYFIQRDTPGTPTKYKITKTDQGYEACSFSVLDEEGFAKARYVILKSKENYILALSVKIPGKAKEKDLAKIFDRLVKTARIYAPKPAQPEN